MAVVRAERVRRVRAARRDIWIRLVVLVFDAMGGSGEGSVGV